jgi:hypothetical protein
MKLLKGRQLISVGTSGFDTASKGLRYIGSKNAVALSDQPSPSLVC